MAIKPLGIIPARYSSSRFPGKPLVDIAGKPMIQRVYESAKNAKHLARVVVATDDNRIADCVNAFGGEVVITAPHHPSGTDRCWEAFELLGDTSFTHIINIQGDEPSLNPAQIDELAEVLTPATQLATQMTAVASSEELFDTGEVKIIKNLRNEALYFSRQAIPHQKGVAEKDWHKTYPYFRHVGMYAYRTDILEKLCLLPLSGLENAESLEQLRWLEAGFTIQLVQTSYQSHCIDTPEDLDKLLASGIFS